ncbi:50S ribosomal protein L25 [Candidatus Parcubacteria bacterium]|nr:MAG: 50S ribosomal protein L25 [Candidatus Parcubacteria bacterium]
MDIAVHVRNKFGKSVQALRREGFIPAELYGHGVPNLHLAVPRKEFSKVFREAGENTVLTLLVGSERKAALIHDVQRDYLTDDVQHVDFYQVRMDEKIKAPIPIEFTGDAPAVKEKGGILNKAMFTIEVEALPGDLPRRLSLSLNSLDDLDKSLYVKDIVVPENVRVLVDPETVIATVTPPAAEEKVEEALPDISSIKVEDEEKKAERAAEKEKKE